MFHLQHSRHLNSSKSKNVSLLLLWNFTFVNSKYVCETHFQSRIWNSITRLYTTYFIYKLQHRPHRLIHYVADWSSNSCCHLKSFPLTSDMVNRKAPIVEFLGMYQNYYIQIIIYWTLLFDTFSEEHVLLKNELEYRSLLFQKFLKIHGCAKFLFLEF